MAHSSNDFGYLRSLLEERYKYRTESWKERLLTHLQRAYIEDADRYEAQWLPYLNDHLSSHDLEFEAKSLSHLARLATLLPKNAQLKISGSFDGERDARHFAHAPHIDRVTHLRVSGGDYFRGKGLEALLDSPLVTNLKKLSIERMRADAIKPKSLALLPELTHLKLEGVKLSTKLADIFIDSGKVNHLKSLSLERNEIKGKDWPVLLESALFANLEHFASRTNLNDKAALAIAEAASLKSLRELHVHAEKLKHKGVSALLSSPHLEGLERLSLYSYDKIGPKAADALAARPAGLKHVTLSYLDFDDKSMKKIAASASLSLCTHLDLHERACSHAGLAALTTSPALANLTGLTIAGIPFSEPSHAEALTKAPTFTDLGSLMFTFCEFTPEGMNALANGLAVFPKLHSLLLDGNKSFDSACARILANTPSMSQLETLSLSGTKVDDDGAAALAESPHLGTLRELDLSGADIHDAGALAIARSSRLDRLDRLVISVQRTDRDDDTVARELLATGKTRDLVYVSARHGHVDDDFITYFADTPELAGAFELNLYNAKFSNAGMKALVESPHFAGIHTLNLTHVDLDLEMVETLARSPHLAHVGHLVLENTGLDDDMLVTLLGSPHLTNLRILELEGNTFGEEGIRAIADCEALSVLLDLRLDGSQVPQDLRPILVDSAHLPPGITGRWRYDW